MSDKLELLRIFERTARLGSFTLAAESLGLSRPNVSRAIRRLEEETGRRLLHRTTRVVTLTNEGETFLAEARRLLALSDRLFAPPKENGEPPLEGTLRIASSVSFAAFFLAGALEDFLSLHPGLCAELLTGEQNLTASRLAASRIDLGFTVSNAVPERVAVRELAATTGVLCASPACVEREGMPDTPEALLTKSVVTSRYPDAWRLVHREDGRALVLAPKARLRHAGALLVLQSVQRGAGFALLPAVAVRGRIASGALLRVLPQWYGEKTPIRAVSADDPSPASPAGRFLAFVSKRLAADNAGLSL